MNEGFNSFIFYKEWIAQIRLLACSEDHLDILTFCDGLEAFLDGETPDDDMTLMATLVYNQVTSQIARDKGSYKDVSEKRSEAGKKGADARWSKATMANDGKAMANDGKTWQTMANDGHKEDDDEDDDVSPNGDVVVCAEPVIGLPLNDGSEHGVTEEELAEYSQLYPAVDVMQQLRNMRGWLLANPQKRKTRRGIKAFIATWLAKEQDHPRARSGTTRKMTAEEILSIPAINPWEEAST